MTNFGTLSISNGKLAKKRTTLLILTVVSTILYVLLYYRESSVNSSTRLSTSNSNLKGSLVSTLKSKQDQHQQQWKTSRESDPNIQRDTNSFHNGKLPLSSCKGNLQNDCVGMAYFWSGDDLKNFLIEGFNINSKDGLATLCVGLVGSAIAYEGLRTLRDYLLNKFIDTRKKWRVIENRCSRINTREQSPTIEVNEEGGPSRPVAGKSIVSHYSGGGGDSEASASLMKSPLDEDEDYELNPHSKPTVPRRRIRRRDGAGDADYYDDGEFETLGVKLGRTEKCQTFSLLVMSTIIHMIYITLGYIFMLSVMTFNVWILVAVGIGIGIGQFLFGVFRRTDIYIDTSATGNTSRQTSSSSDYGGDIFTSPNSSAYQQEQRHPMIAETSQLQEEEERQRLGDINSTAIRTCDVNVHAPSKGPGQLSDYYSNSSGSGSSNSTGSGIHIQCSNEQQTTEISVHTVATPDSLPNQSSN